jgi:hypothetical protein
VASDRFVIVIAGSLFEIEPEQRSARVGGLSKIRQSGVLRV